MQHQNALIPSRSGLTAYVYANPRTLFIVATLVGLILLFVYMLVGRFV